MLKRGLFQKESLPSDCRLFAVLYWNSITPPPNIYLYHWFIFKVTLYLESLNFYKFVLLFILGLH